MKLKKVQRLTSNKAKPGECSCTSLPAGRFGILSSLKLFPRGTGTQPENRALPYLRNVMPNSMKTLLNILILILMISIHSKACQAFDLGLIGTVHETGALVEIEVLNAVDSSDWKLYPNGFNHRETYRLLVDCKIIQSNNHELKDSLRLIFSLKSADFYDSLGNYQLSICGDIMHTGTEFELQKGEKYVVFIKKHPFYNEGKKEWWLLRAEKMDYNLAYKDFTSAKMIDDYLKVNYNRELNKEMIMLKVFTVVIQNTDSEKIESVLYYNPLVNRFALIKTDYFCESEKINFDLDSQPFRIESDYFEVFTTESRYRLNKVDLKPYEEKSKIILKNIKRK